MKILITGSTGFLGSRLKSHLSDLDVLALNRRGDQKHGLGPIDLSQAPDLHDLPKVDVVVHLAQSRRYREFPQGIEDMIGVNVDATVKLLEYARACGVKQFIFASTGSVYSPENQVLYENQMLRPSTAYPASKFAAEVLMEPYRQFFNIACLRLFFLYGPGQEGMLIPNLVNNIRSGSSISLQGENGFLFCPTYIDDVADVFVETIRKEIDGTFNVASPEVISLKAVASQIANILGVSVDFKYEQGKSPLEFRPALDQVREWYPIDEFRSFSAGIASTLEMV